MENEQQERSEAEVSPEVESSVLKIEQLIAEIKDARKDIEGVLSATQELTKVVGELNAAWEKWRKAGKF